MAVHLPFLQGLVFDRALAVGENGKTDRSHLARSLLIGLVLPEKNICFSFRFFEPFSLLDLLQSGALVL